MSNNSNASGRAYEYAWMNSLYKAIYQKRPTTLQRNSSLNANKQAWIQIDQTMRQTFMRSADAAVETVVALEPQMLAGDDELTLSFQTDEAGIGGDVRDIVIKRPAIGWEIGLSIKHNHEAIKHSRLSHRLDFGNSWYGQPCSDAYWQAIAPIFDRLKIEKRRGTYWLDMADRDDGIYVPLLQAFIDEVERAYQNDPLLPQKMMEYLLGKQDYYKIIGHDKKRTTTIYTFNIHGTLDKSVPLLLLPTQLIDLSLTAGRKDMVTMELNNGWRLSFRIHNASSIAEPSLKFDVQFIAMPDTVKTFQRRW